MERDVLSRVLEAEKEIQERLREEKSRSLEWTERAKKEAEEELAREEERARENCRKDLEAARLAAENEAAELVRASLIQSEGLDAVGDELLTAIVTTYIREIVPAGHPTRGE
jgi:vacuolar-type H+-ATPase subunit H